MIEFIGYIFLFLIVVKTLDFTVAWLLIKIFLRDDNDK